jgi:hypothetical protein
MSGASMTRYLEVVALALVIAALGAGLAWVPSWNGVAGEPCLQGMLACALVVVVLLASRMCARAARLERMVLALFLASMPIPYLGSWVLRAPGERAWLALELVALPLYGGLAWLGYRRGATWLALGTAAHGVFWDSWHLHGVPFMPSWYARACLLIDVTLALYIVARARGSGVGSAGAPALERA